MGSVFRRPDNGRWTAQVYVRGKPVRMVPKDNTRAGARRLLRKLEEDVVRSQTEDVRPELTLGELGKLYLERRGSGPGGWRKRVWGTIEKFLGAETAIAAIDLAAAERMAKAMKAKEHGPASINRKRAVLIDAFNWAVRRPDETGVTRFPFEHWERLSETEAKGKAVFLTPKELAAVYGVLQASAADWRPTAVRLAIETGMRRGELLDLAVKDLRLGEGKVYARASKHGNARWVPISRGMAKELKSLQKGRSPGEGLFPPRPASEWALERFWGKARASAGVRTARLHDLRHTFASRMLERGEPLRIVQYLMGHKAIQSTMVYAHFSADVELPAPLATPKTGDGRRRAAAGRKRL